MSSFSLFLFRFNFHNGFFKQNSHNQRERSFVQLADASNYSNESKKKKGTNAAPTSAQENMQAMRWQCSAEKHKPKVHIIKRSKTLKHTPLIYFLVAVVSAAGDCVVAFPILVEMLNQ